MIQSYKWENELLELIPLQFAKVISINKKSAHSTISDDDNRMAKQTLSLDCNS